MGPKKSTGGKVLYCSDDLPVTEEKESCADGQCWLRAQALLGLLNHTFAEVCHFGIFYFLLV